MPAYWDFPRYIQNKHTFLSEVVRGTFEGLNREKFNARFIPKSLGTSHCKNRPSYSSIIFPQIRGNFQDNPGKSRDFISRLLTNFQRTGMLHMTVFMFGLPKASSSLALKTKHDSKSGITNSLKTRWFWCLIQGQAFHAKHYDNL